MATGLEPALGMVETRGLIGAIEAADAMVKCALVRLVRAEVTQAALVTVQIVGEVAAVQAAVDAGERAAKKVGQVVSCHVIPNPDAAVRAVLLLDQEPAEPQGRLPDYADMTVQQLRVRARAIPGFPLQGRAIASAKKSELLALLEKHG